MVVNGRKAGTRFYKVENSNTIEVTRSNASDDDSGNIYGFVSGRVILEDSGSRRKPTHLYSLRDIVRTYMLDPRFCDVELVLKDSVRLRINRLVVGLMFPELSETQDLDLVLLPDWSKAQFEHQLDKLFTGHLFIVNSKRKRKNNTQSLVKKKRPKSILLPEPTGVENPEVILEIEEDRSLPEPEQELGQEPEQERGQELESIVEHENEPSVRKVSPSLSIQDINTIALLRSNNLKTTDPKQKVVVSQQKATTSCRTCKSPISSSREARNHRCLDPVFNPYKCSGCKKIIHLKGELLSHMCAVEGGGGTEQEPGKEQRYSNLQESKENEQPQRSCRVCGDLFTDPKTCFVHEIVSCNIFGKNSSHDRSLAPPLSTLGNECEICAWKFSTPQQKLAHQRKEHVNVIKRTYPCDLCEKVFTVKSSLRNHLAKHSEGNLSICDICAAEFRSVEALLLHQTREHADLSHRQRFPCSYCDKVFRFRVQIQQHERIHTKEKPFKCEKCGKGFSVKCNLKIHMETHKNPEERQYKCNQCPHAATSQVLLNLHMNSHTGLRPYTCPDCGNSYKRPSNLRRHRQSGCKKALEQVEPSLKQDYETVETVETVIYATGNNRLISDKSRRAVEEEDFDEEEDAVNVQDGEEDEEDVDVKMKEDEEGSSMYMMAESGGQNSVYIMPDDNNDGIPFLEVIEEEVVVEDGPQYEAVL